MDRLSGEVPDSIAGWETVDTIPGWETGDGHIGREGVGTDVAETVLPDASDLVETGGAESTHPVDTTETSDAPDGWEAHAETPDCEGEAAEQVGAADLVEEADLVVQESGADVCGDLGEVDAASEFETIPIPPECDDGNDIPWDGCTDGKITEFKLGEGEGSFVGTLDAAAVAGGGFVVTGTSSGQDGCDDDVGIYVRIFDSAGFSVSDFVDLDECKEGHYGVASHVTVLDEQHALVAWTSYPSQPWANDCGNASPDGDGVRTLARTVDLLTSELGPEWQIDVDGLGWQTAEAVVAPTEFSAWVVWQEVYSLPPSGVQSASRLMGREFSSAGPGPAAFQIDGGCGLPLKQPCWVSGVQHPVAVVLSDGNVAVVWGTNATTALGCEDMGFCGALVGRVFLPDGTPVTEEFLIPKPGGFCMNPYGWGGATALANGGFAVSYTGHEGLTQESHILSASVGPLGELTGPIVQVDSVGPYSLFLPLVASLAGGYRAIGWWENDQDDGHFSLMERLQFPEGDFAGTESMVVSCPPDECFVSPPHALIALPSGEFLMLWEADDGGLSHSLYAQRFGPDGKKLYH